MNFKTKQALETLSVIGSFKSLLSFFLPLYVMGYAVATLTALCINTMNLEAEDELLYMYANNVVDCTTGCVYTTEEQNHFSAYIKKRTMELDGRYDVAALLTFDRDKLVEDYKARFETEVKEIEIGRANLNQTKEDKQDWEESKADLRTQHEGIENSFKDIEDALGMFTFPWVLILWLMAMLMSSVGLMRTQKA